MPSGPREVVGEMLDLDGCLRRAMWRSSQADD